METVSAGSAAALGQVQGDGRCRAAELPGEILVVATECDGQREFAYARRAFSPQKSTAQIFAATAAAPTHLMSAKSAWELRHEPLPEPPTPAISPVPSPFALRPTLSGAPLRDGWLRRRTGPGLRRHVARMRPADSWSRLPCGLVPSLVPARVRLHLDPALALLSGGPLRHRHSETLRWNRIAHGLKQLHLLFGQLHPLPEGRLATLDLLHTQAPECQLQHV